MACHSDAEADSVVASLLTLAGDPADGGAKGDSTTGTPSGTWDVPTITASAACSLPSLAPHAPPQSRFPDCLLCFCTPSVVESAESTVPKKPESLTLRIPGRGMAEVYPATSILVSSARGELCVSEPKPEAASPITPGVSSTRRFFVIHLSSGGSSDSSPHGQCGARADGRCSDSSMDAWMNTTSVQVPLDKQAMRHADSGRVWQTKVFPAVQDAVLAWNTACRRSSDSTHKRCEDPYLLLVALSPGLESHLAVLAALAAILTCDRSLRRLQASSVVTTATTPHHLSEGWPALCKADIRSCVALAQMPLRVGSVPRAMLQQLNIWLLTNHSTSR